MLRNLYIKNFILIDDLNIDFSDSFSVFTGETGAGKSIFIDSIAILCGDKLTAGMIKQGKEKAIIEGTFDVCPTLAAKLSQAGFDNDTLIVSREITSDGRSTARINQRSTTVSFIRDCLENMVDIHCQHDNQYLLNEKYHLRLLDEYCSNEELLKECAQRYKQYHDAQSRLDELLSTTYNGAQMEIIRYQLKEISALSIKDTHEDELIEQQLKNAAEIEKIRENIEQVQNLFDNDGILSKLYQFTKMSSSLSSISEIEGNIHNIIDAYYSIADDYEQMSTHLRTLNFDEASINELNQRLYDLQKAKRKYATSLKGLTELKEELQKQVDAYENREDVLSEAQKTVDETLAMYNTVANKLSDIRKTKARQLKKEIIEQCRDLSLVNADFEIEFVEGRPSAKGSDEVSFKISMNAGQPLQALNKVASGGELSRLMLGLKVIFARLQGTELIIFDEIDTGVSGKVALAIGVKMAKLARSIQVFAVTHLSSVAACGKNHYFISKKQNNDSTTTVVCKLNEQDHIQQVAILSSSDITDASLIAAGELISKAHELCGD